MLSRDSLSLSTALSPSPCLSTASTGSTRSSNRSVSRNRSRGALGAFDLQYLEGRTMMAANPLNVRVIDNVLTVTGTAKADRIMVTQSGSRWTVQNGAWRKQVTGNFEGLYVDGKNGNDSIAFRSTDDAPCTLIGGNGNDTVVGGNGNDQLIGGNGNDRLVGMAGNDWEWGDAGNDVIDGSNDNDNIYGGAGNDRLNGGAGDDVLVSIGGGTKDIVAGSSGLDSFWIDDASTERIMDPSTEEVDARAFHFVDGFEDAFGYTVSKELNGQNLLDPTIMSGDGAYKDFGSHYLFSEDGPSIDDVNQGACGDCYFLATLASYAHVNPEVIKQSVVDLGDGTFAVRFTSNGRDLFYRVDGELTVNSSGELAYANFGADDTIWVSIMEKAWCFAREDAGTYESIEGGWMDEVANALGHTGERFENTLDGEDLLDVLETAVANGVSVTIGTVEDQYLPYDSAVVGMHAYTVIGVERDSDGNRWLILRNPWGIDNTSESRDGTQDGYVFITAGEAADQIHSVVIADAS